MSTLDEVLALRGLRAEVVKLALDHPQSDRHAASRSHIVFASWMEPFGAKGIGNFPDEAFVNYRLCVEAMVETASKRDLEMWLAKFEEAVDTYGLRKTP